MLLKESDDLILAVYDYWVDKRLRLKRPLAPKVKRDTRMMAPNSAGGDSAGGGGSSANTNPYVAFRRRTEKMQTRKNREIDVQRSFYKRSLIFLVLTAEIDLRS